MRILRQETAVLCLPSPWVSYGTLDTEVQNSVSRGRKKAAKRKKERMRRMKQGTKLLQKAYLREGRKGESNRSKHFAGIMCRAKLEKRG